MPKIINPVLISSKKELKSRLKELLDIQKKDSIVAIRGLNLTEKEQLQLVRDLGDISGWYPNNSEEFNHKYVENHGLNEAIKNSNKDEIFLDWHLERVDYDDYIPIVTGVWNMRVFNCDPEAGKTYFIDSRKIFQSSFTEEEKNFLRECRAAWEEGQDTNKKTHRVNVIQKHWATNEEQIRVKINKSLLVELETISGAVPTSEEVRKFNILIDRFSSEVYENQDFRLIYKWQKGDIVIPDLYSLAHAVTGGFLPEDREFTGYWCYRSSPQVSGEEKTPPSWRGM